MNPTDLEDASLSQPVKKPLPLFSLDDFEKEQQEDEQTNNSTNLHK